MVMGASPSAYNGGMVRHDRYQKFIAALICGLLLGVMAALGGITAGHAHGEIASKASEKPVTVAVLRESEGVWTVNLSHGLDRLTKGRVMALLLTLEVPDGVRIRELQVCGSARSLRLTVGEAVENRIAVLLDGYAAEGDGEAENGAILKVYTDGSGGYMGVTAGKYGELAIYCLGEDGQCVKIPVEISTNTPEESGESLTETRENESDGEGETEEAESRVESSLRTEGETEWTTEIGAEERPEGKPAVQERNRFVGCRETLPKNGSFSVQLLFYGTGWETPAVCIEGGGTVTLRVEYGLDLKPDGERELLEKYGEGNWSICTFAGLSAERTYVFLIFTHGKTVRAVYENGIFMGYR